MTTAIDYLRLADDQREVIHQAIAVPTAGLRESSDLSLRALGELLPAYSRLEDFADGFGPLLSEDQSLLVEALTDYRRESTETAEYDAENLPALEAGTDPSLIYVGYTRGESVEMMTGYIAQERTRAKLCGEVLGLLSEGG
jgi:hypothetical protein